MRKSGSNLSQRPYREVAARLLTTLASSKSLLKMGVTLSLLWNEYCEQCYAAKSFATWAAKIWPNAETVVKTILASHKIEQQG